MAIINQATIHAARPQGDLFLAGIVFIVTFILMFIVTVFACLFFTKYQIIPAVHTVYNHSVPFEFMQRPWPVYHWTSTFELVVTISQVFATIISVVISIYVFFVDRPKVEIFIEGRRRVDGDKAIEKWDVEMDEEQEWGLPGLPLITTPEGDELTISQDRETRHIAVFGSIGGGKTTVIRNYIDAARARGDRCVILDSKSDMTATLANFNDVILIAPWDERGWAWDVAADLRTKADAQAFAAATIPVSEKDPMFGNAARGIEVACILRAQNEAPGQWGFGFLADILRKGEKEIQWTVDNFAPEYSLIVRRVDGLTALSILTNLIAFFMPFFDLADAWSKSPTPNKFSIRRWLHEEGIEAGKNTIIIQGDGGFGGLQAAVTQAIFAALTREITSPKITDVRPDKRQIQIFCDEFPQFGMIDNFGTLVEVGRSKGIRIVLGLQDISQLRKIYGNDTTQTWMSSIGTYVICRMNGLETPEWLTKVVGKKRVKIYNPSHSNDGVSATSRTDQYQEQELAVMRVDDWGRTLKVHKDGVRIAVFTGGDHLYLVDAKMLTADQKKKRRATKKEAAWTLVGWPSAADAARVQAMLDDQKKQDNSEPDEENQEEER